MQSTGPTRLDALEDYYGRIQSSYAKLVVAHFTLRAGNQDAATRGASEASDKTQAALEAENDSRLEEAEVDDIHTGEMAGLGAKWEADAFAEEERLLTARAAVYRLNHELSTLIGQSERLAQLREELAAAGVRARKLEAAKARGRALKQRRQRAMERKARLEKQKADIAASRTGQERLREELTAARNTQLEIVASEELNASKMDVLIQLLQ